MVERLGGQRLGVRSRGHARRRSVAPSAISALRRLVQRNARARVLSLFRRLHPVDGARYIEPLPPGDRAHLFSMLVEDPSTSRLAGDLLLELESPIADAIVEHLSSANIGALVSSLPPDEAAEVVSRLPDELAKVVMGRIGAESAADVHRLLEHDANSAGRIMTTRFFALSPDATVGEAIAEMQARAGSDGAALYLYVVEESGRLLGVVGLRALLIHPAEQKLSALMVPDVVHVRADTSRDEAGRLASRYGLLAIPVVDAEERLVGVVTVDDVLDVIQSETEKDLMQLAGVASDERAGGPVGRSLRRRAPWLTVNLFTAFIASFVVAQFEGTIGRLPALAALMPIVAGMGGNAATQTMTVVIRGLALRDLPAISWTAAREGLVGAGNGLITGLLGGLWAAVSFHSALLGVIIGAALLINLTLAAVMGTLVPVGLSKIGVDPAVASSVFVTTSTDIAGFFTFLGMASLAMDSLV